MRIADALKNLNFQLEGRRRAASALNEFESVPEDFEWRRDWENRFAAFSAASIK